MPVFSVAYEPEPILDPISGEKRLMYIPLLEIMVAGENRELRKVSCVVDSGADFNLFPTELAYQYLGMTEKTLKSGKELRFIGIGDMKLGEPAYAHKITLRHPYFEFDTWVFFVDNQYPPLLGREGFMNEFKRIEFNSEAKKLVLDM